MQPSTAMGPAVDKTIPPARRRLTVVGLKRHVLSCILFVVTFLSMVATKWEIGGIPVRAAVAGGMLIILAIFLPRSFNLAVKRSRVTLTILTIFGVWGAVLSILNEVPVSDVLGQLIQIHIQGAINFLLAYLIAERIGVRRAATIFIACAVLSALVATAQAIGFDWAWNARLWVADVVGEDLLSDYYYRYQRPMGLALSPVRLGLQLCLALAVYLITMRDPYKAFGKLDFRPFFACIIFAIGAISGQNRSPLLGCVIFLIIYLSIVKPRYIPLLVAISVILVPLGLSYMDSMEGVRIADVEDESSRGRLTFMVYGTLLFISRPIGYGLNFDPRDYWPAFWDAIQWTPVPSVVRIFELHNYPLTMLNMYGVALILALPFLFRISKLYMLSTISLVPYFVHIFFHNDGPMWSDFLIWFVFAYTVIARDNANSRSDTDSHTRADTRLEKLSLPSSRISSSNDDILRIK